MQITIRKGLDIPLSGKPRLEIETAREVSSVASLGLDTPGLKPKMAVQQGDRVKLGQVLFIDKRNPDIPFTAPGCGTISVINRGERRILHSVVIELDGSKEQAFPVFEPTKIESIDAEKVRSILIESGQWTYLRTRPYSSIPAPGDKPNSIFITAIDTNPLAPEPAVIIAEDTEAFLAGIKVIAKLTDGPTYHPFPGSGQREKDRLAYRLPGHTGCGQAIPHRTTVHRASCRSGWSDGG
jgi:Na+-transporting NADH:ubiquinone oxidoreductase subunit A